MIAYDAWEREYQKNKSAYLDIFDSFMSKPIMKTTKTLKNTLLIGLAPKHVVV